MQQTDAARANVLGVGISAINMEDALRSFRTAIERGGKRYVCVTGVHGIMEAQRNATLKRVLNESYLVTPDGMPTVWVGKLEGHRRMQQVCGPELMLRVCELSQEAGHSHFLYGGTPEIIERLRANLSQRFPRLNIVGTYAPPFRRLNEREEKDLVERVFHAKPDVFWVGLSTPKQELFMSEYLHRLDTKLMVGVGAAFNIHAGVLRDAPKWVKHAGLQWLHRLLQEPSRLWKRYLINNPQFVVKIALQLGGLTRHSL